MGSEMCIRDSVIHDVIHKVIHSVIHGGHTRRSYTKVIHGVIHGGHTRRSYTKVIMQSVVVVLACAPRWVRHWYQAPNGSARTRSSTSPTPWCTPPASNCRGGHGAVHSPRLPSRPFHGMLSAPTVILHYCGAEVRASHGIGLIMAVCVVGSHTQVIHGPYTNRFIKYVTAGRQVEQGYT